MELGQIFTAVLSLIFVLGLLFLTIWGLKWLQNKSCNLSFCGHLKSARHIKIIEQHRLDAKNQIVLLEADKVRYLMLIGAENNLLLNQSPAKGGKRD